MISATSPSAKKAGNLVRRVFDNDIYGDIEEMQILSPADDFLHNMARIIVGTLMDIGRQPICAGY